jgi:predicted ATP-grasp superfamily ATP-dependent carboligase
VSEALTARLRALGDRLAAAFDLVGWFGVDYVLRDGIPWPVEVNPRYTASVEIHELAAGRPLLLEHRAACEGIMEPARDSRTEGQPRHRVVTKWIIYAPRRLVVPAQEWPDDSIDEPDAFAADIPAPGVCIEVGEPVMTLLVKDSHVVSCRARLRRLRRSWAARLGRLTTDH